MRKLLPLLFFSFACTPSQRLEYTNTYKVMSTYPKGTGSSVQFAGVKGRYLLNSDTLKAGDFVKINVITRQ